MFFKKLSWPVGTQLNVCLNERATALECALCSRFWNAPLHFKGHTCSSNTFSFTFTPYTHMSGSTKTHSYWCCIGYWCQPEGFWQGLLGNSHSPCPGSCVNWEVRACVQYYRCVCLLLLLYLWSDSSLWDRRSENRGSFGGRKQITVSSLYCLTASKFVCAFVCVCVCVCVCACVRVCIPV